jgi:uncharacterized YccA/Bax inhibitor family protein
MRTAFKRINSEFSGSTGEQVAYGGPSQAGPQAGGWTGSAGPGWGAPYGNHPYADPGGYGYRPVPGYGGQGPGAPGWGAGGYGGGWQPVPVRRFSAARTYDRLAGLCLLALVAGVVGYLALPAQSAFGFMLLAFALVVVGWFKMTWAKVLAPAYSLAEGLALGSVSRLFASFGHGIVPTAIVFTGAVFMAALVLYRTGLVKVTPRLVSLAFMGAMGILAVSLLSLIGLSVPGLNELSGAGLVFSVLALAIAVINLFADFQFVASSEAQGVSAEAEWAAAFAMMTALVLVYISMLRILGAAYGGGRRR